MNHLETPIVSIICYAYNHEKYIRQAIEGFIMQQTNFSFEIVIHDDASTDNTAAIIKEYEAKYPQLFSAIYQNENQHSQEKGRVTKICFEAAKGKYIAMCEGDDYWTDPLKLQKQVDFLEGNPDYSLVCSGYKSLNTFTKKEEFILKDVENSPDNTAKGFDITIERFLKDWLTQPLTLIFRKEFYNIEDFIDYKHSRDVHLIYHLLRKGNGYYMKNIFATYNIHSGGLFSSASSSKRLVTGYHIYKELYYKNKSDKYLKKVYFNVLCIMIDSKIYLEDAFFKKNHLILELLFLVKSKNDFKKFILILNKQYVGLKNIFKRR